MYLNIYILNISMHMHIHTYFNVYILNIPCMHVRRLTNQTLIFNFLLIVEEDFNICTLLHGK